MNRGIHRPVMRTPISQIIRVKTSSHRGQRLKEAPPTEDELRRVEALYLGEVTFVDKCIGQLLSKIEELKLRDDTLVVVLSDHGTQLRDQGRFGKGPDQLHPFNTQLNLLIRHPTPASSKVRRSMRLFKIMT